ncbi:MAG: GNAT family N-acetyltransferase [Verrucomicrobiota bacterium]
MITTRFAEARDLSTILELVHLKAAFDGFPDSVTATKESLENGLFSDSPEAQVLLAESEGEVIGMASFHSHYSTFIAKPGIWLDDLFVREEQRGRGAGEALMIRLAQICRDMGGSRIEWSTAARNALGIKFYERIGSVVFEGSRLTRLEGVALEQLAALPGAERRAEQGAAPKP